MNEPTNEGRLEDYFADFEDKVLEYFEADTTHDGTDGKNPDESTSTDVLEGAQDAAANAEKTKVEKETNGYTAEEERAALAAYLKEEYDLDYNSAIYQGFEITDETRIEDVPQDLRDAQRMNHENPVGFYNKYIMPLQRVEMLKILNWTQESAKSQEQEATARTEFLSTNPQVRSQYDKLIAAGRSEVEATAIVKDLFGEHQTTTPRTKKPVKGSQPTGKTDQGGRIDPFDFITQAALEASE